MKAKIDIFGIWWFKGKKKKISGRLQYSEEIGAILEFAIINNPALVEKASDTELLTIYGIDSNGNAITLYDCHYRSMKYSRKNIAQYKYSARYLIIGSHRKNFEKENYQEVKVEYQLMQNWAGITGLTGGFVYDSEDVLLEIKYSRPQEKTILNNKDIRMTISVMTTLSPDLQHEPVIEIAVLKIHAKKKKTFKYFYDYIIMVQDFLSLCMNRPCYINEIAILNRKKSSEIIQTESVVLYQPPYIGKNIDPDVLINDIIFRLCDIEKNIEQLLSNWIDMYSHSKDALRLYFINIYRPSDFYNSKFLNLANSIESFDRESKNGFFEDVATFENTTYPIMVQAIPKELAPEYKENIKGKLKWINELSLRGRLKVILSGYEVFITKVWSTNNEFINDLVDTRNYYTHFTSELKAKVEKKDNLDDLYYTLKNILTCLFFVYIGIDKEKAIKKILEIRQKA